MSYDSTTEFASLSKFDSDAIDAVFTALEVECFGASHGLQGIGDPADDLTPMLWEQGAMVLDDQAYNGMIGEVSYSVTALRAKLAHRVARAIINVHGLNEA